MFLIGDKFNYIDRREMVDSPTVTRDSEAYYKNAEGYLAKVEADELRYRYSDGNFAGLLVEADAHQSVIAHSEVFSDDAFWQKENITIGSASIGPDDVADSATRVTATGTAAMEYRLGVAETTFTLSSGSGLGIIVAEFIAELPTDTPPAVFGTTTGETALGDAADLDWPTHQTDDIGVILFESNGALTSTPAGWDVMGTTGLSSGSGTNTQLTVLWARATSAAMGAATLQAASGNHFYARMMIVRGAKTSGVPYAQYIPSVSGSSTTAKSVAPFVPVADESLILVMAAYGNDASSLTTSAWDNDTLGAFTVHINGMGTINGNGGGVIAASAEFENIGYLSSENAVSTFFVKPINYRTPVKLYNYRHTDEFTEFDLSTGEKVSGEGSIEEYADGWYRLTANKSNDIDEYGFGFEFSGEMLVFGANLVEGSGDIQYLFNDEEMPGDVLSDVSGAALLYSNVPEPSTYDAGPNGAAAIWTAGTYNTGDRRIENHILYQVTATPSTSTQPSVGAVEDPVKWVAVSPSNQYKMFDDETGADVATLNEGSIEFVIQSDQIMTDFGVHNVDAEQAIITVYEMGEPIYEKSIDMITDYGIDDFYDWALKERVYIRQFYESGIPWSSSSVLSVRFVNESGGVVKVGKFVPGVTVMVGVQLDDMAIEGRDFSRLSRNQFGIASIAQGREIDIKRFNIAIEPERVSYLIEKLKDAGIAATTWGVPGYDGALAYGFRTRRDFTYSLIDSRAEITIEEV